jgi:hypothetical protein
MLPFRLDENHDRNNIKMVMKKVNPEEFRSQARIMMQRHSDCSGAAAVESMRFRAMFGTRAEICSLLWDMIEPSDFTMGKGAKSCHLLWALMFLKLYATEATLSALAGGVDEKTFRKWSGRFVSAIADLTPEVVSKHCTSTDVVVVRSICSNTNSCEDCVEQSIS